MLTDARIAVLRRRASGDLLSFTMLGGTVATFQGRCAFSLPTQASARDLHLGSRVLARLSRPLNRGGRTDHRNRVAMTDLDGSRPLAPRTIAAACRLCCPAGAVCHPHRRVSMKPYGDTADPVSFSSAFATSSPTKPADAAGICRLRIGSVFPAPGTRFQRGAKTRMDPEAIARPGPASSARDRLLSGAIQVLAGSMRTPSFRSMTSVTCRCSNGSRSIVPATG